jgi:hypothetical protein
MRFAAALAAALPSCTVGQQPVAPGGSLTRCIAAGVSVVEVEEQIAAALPAVLEAAPDHVVVDSQGFVRMNWYDFAWFLGGGGHAVLDIAILTMIIISAGVAFAGAYLGGDDLRGRLKWLGATLFAPGSLFLVMGLALVSPWTVGMIGRSLAATRWDGVQYSDSYREAVANLVVPVVQQIGSGFLLTGVVACVIALGLLIWGWATPSKGQGSAKMVNIPVRESTTD